MKCIRSQLPFVHKYNNQYARKNIGIGGGGRCHADREQSPYHQKPRFTHTHAHDGITGHHSLTDKATAEKKQKQGNVSFITMK